MSSASDQIGSALVQYLHDKAVASAAMIVDGRAKAPAALALQNRLLQLSDDQKQAVLELVRRSCTSGLHDFLFHIQTEADSGKESRTRLLVGDIEPATLSDGLHGELFGKSGWLEKFSKYKNEHGA